MIAAAAVAAAAVFIWLERRHAPVAADPAPAPAAIPAPEPVPDPGPANPVTLPPSEDAVIVRFQDGTELPVRIGFVIPLPAPVHAGWPPNVRYAALRPMAEAGDAVAARALYELLDGCLMASVSMATTRPHCAGVTTEQMSESLDWLQRAASGGDFIAGQRWAERLGHSQAGFEAWEARWRQGDPAALLALARHYERGVPASTGGQPDPVRAHAYRLVDYHLREAVYSQFQGLQAARTQHGDSVRDAGGRLSPQQEAEAQALAKRILGDNRDCCRGIW